MGPTLRASWQQLRLHSQGWRSKKSLLASSYWFPRGPPPARQHSRRCQQQLRPFASSTPRSGGGSPRNAQPIQIPAHLLAFSILMVPVLAILAYYERYTDEEQLEHKLRQRYGKEIREASDKNKQMADHFARVIYNPDAATDAQLNALLMAGRGDQKRLHGVDERLYGTSEGTLEKQRVEEELKTKKKKKKKPKKTGDAEEATASLELSSSSSEANGKRILEDSERSVDEVSSSSNDSTTPRSMMPAVDAKSVVTLTLVATLAATIGFLAGGSKRT